MDRERSNFTADVTFRQRAFNYPWLLKCFIRRYSGKYAAPSALFCTCEANNEDSLTSRTYRSQLLLTTCQLMKSLFLKNLPKTFSLFISCRNRPVEITMMSLEPEPLSFWPVVVFDTVITTKQQLMLTTSINPSGTFQRQSLMTAAASSRRRHNLPRSQITTPKASTTNVPLQL